MTESQDYNCSISRGGNANCIRLDCSLKVANIPLGLAIDRLVTHHDEIIITPKKPPKNSRTVLLEDDLAVEKA
jgi:hypothetical protein